jgi:hypothetical protein
LVPAKGTSRTIDRFGRPRQTACVARYSALMGRRIGITYRAGDVVLPAKGILAADSGKSIFLEELYNPTGITKTFRWEIPYVCIIELREVLDSTMTSEPEKPPADTAAGTSS